MGNFHYHSHHMTERWLEPCYEVLQEGQVLFFYVFKLKGFNIILFKFSLKSIYCSKQKQKRHEKKIETLRLTENIY